MRKARATVIGLMLLASAGCGDKAAAPCAVQTVQGCACTTGGAGSQVCLADGTWGACTCEVADAGFTPYVPTDASRLPRLDAHVGGYVADAGADVGTAPH